MLKWFKSIVWGIRLKSYFNIIQHEIWIKVIDGEAIPENYFWKRVEKLIEERKEKWEHRLMQKRMMK